VLLSQPVAHVDYTARDAILPRIQESFQVPHAILAHVCIAQLIKCGLQNYLQEAKPPNRRLNFHDLLHSDKLLDYSHSAWVAHTHQCGHHPPVLEAITDLVLNSTAFPLFKSTFPDFGGSLHVAAAFGLVDMILPAAQLQSPNVLTSNGDSPLTVAVKNNQLACAKALLSLPDIDVNAGRRSGATPLMFAAARGSIECVELLAAPSGIEINAGGPGGWTALMSNRGSETPPWATWHQHQCKGFERLDSPHPCR
jgi:Ankyrin repeats (3 copies)